MATTSSPGLKSRMVRRFDDAREIDAEQQREAARYRGFSRQREAVFVVDGGVGHLDRHVAIHQIAFPDIGESDVLPGSVFSTRTALNDMSRFSLVRQGFI